MLWVSAEKLALPRKEKFDGLVGDLAQEAAAQKRKSAVHTGRGFIGFLVFGSTPSAAAAVRRHDTPGEIVRELAAPGVRSTVDAVPGAGYAACPFRRRCTRIAWTPAVPE